MWSASKLSFPACSLWFLALGFSILQQSLNAKCMSSLLYLLLVTFDFKHFVTKLQCEAQSLSSSCSLWLLTMHWVHNVSFIFSFLLWNFPCWTFLSLKFRASKCEVWTCECWENCVMNRLWGHWLLFDTLNTCISLTQILEVKVKHANDALDALDAFNVELFIFQNNMWMEVVKVIEPFLQFLHAYNSH
jgi:hypothetical protein